MPKSLAEYQADIDRMTEWLFTNRGQVIKNMDDFEREFKDNMNDGKSLSGLGEKIQKKAFEEYRGKFDPEVSLEKDVEREERKIQRRDQVQDLVLKAPPKESVPAVSNKRVISARPSVITRRGKKVSVLRDAKGRFVKRI